MADFEPSETFTGTKEGYFFGTGPKGVGYYRDLGPIENAAAATAEAATATTSTALSPVQQLLDRHRGIQPDQRVGIDTCAVHRNTSCNTGRTREHDEVHGGEVLTRCCICLCGIIHPMHVSLAHTH